MTEAKYLKKIKIPKGKEDDINEYGFVTEGYYARVMKKIDAAKEYEMYNRRRLMFENTAVVAGFTVVAMAVSYVVAPEWTAEAIKTAGVAVKDVASLVCKIGGVTLDALGENIPEAAGEFVDTISDNIWKTTKLVSGLAIAGAAIVSVGSMIKGQQKGYHDQNRAPFRLSSERSK